MLPNINSDWNLGDDSSNPHLNGARYAASRQDLPALLLSWIDSNVLFINRRSVFNEI